MPATQLAAEALRLFELCREQSLKLAVAESCTGGLISAATTEIPGASAIFDRGFVTYSNEAKTAMLGVRPEFITKHGAVSAAVAIAMAEGALAHSQADVAIAVTGIAGPTGGSAEKPVGLVHIAAARIGAETLHIERRYGLLERTTIRMMAARDAVLLAQRTIERPEGVRSE
jgi:nicotinamide-nucleotide amidase